MTVAELIEQLRELPPEMTVVTYGENLRVFDEIYDSPKIVFVTPCAPVFGDYRISETDTGLKVVRI